jgi:hypothetical protein
MTTLFKHFLALLFILASGIGQAQAAQTPPAQPEVAVQAMQINSVHDQESPVRVAWQRVGSPLREA